MLIQTLREEQIALLFIAYINIYFAAKFFLKFEFKLNKIGSKKESIDLRNE